jgi:nitrate reductase NapAB chaperone NapD
MAKNLRLAVFCMFGKKLLLLEPTEIYDVGNNGKLILVLKFSFSAV